MPKGDVRERSTAKGARGVHGRLGLDWLHVVGAVRRGRLVFGLLVLHGVDDLVVGRRDGRARDGADDEDPEVAEVVRAACAELKFLGACEGRGVSACSATTAGQGAVFRSGAARTVVAIALGRRLTTLTDGVV